MKRNLKKTALCILLVMVMLASFGCASANKTSSSSSSSAATAAATTAAEATTATEAAEGATTAEAREEPVTIEYWNQMSATFGGPQVDQFIKDFMEINKNITVKSVSKGNYMEIAKSLQASLAAGIHPGVVQVGYSYLNYFAENFNQFVEPNTIIMDYFPEDANYLNEKFSPAVLELTKAVNGRMLGMPYCISVPLLYYNKDIFKEAGLDENKPPRTWQEVRDYARQIKEKTGLYGLAIQTPTDTFAIVPMFLSNGIANMYEPDGKGGYKTAFNNEKAVEAWTFLQNLSKDGYYAPLAAEEGATAFLGGKIGMYYSTSARATYVANNVDFRGGATTIPTFGDNKLQVCIGGNCLAIFAKEDAEIRASWQFMKYLFESAQINTWVRGTGYLPPTLDAPNDPNGLKPYFDEAPMLVLALKERDEAARAWTSWPGQNGLQVDQHLVNMRDAIMNDKKDVKAVLAETAATIDELLKQ